MEWWFFLAGVLLAAPVTAAVVLLRARRRLLQARRLITRARTKEQMVELARLTAGLAHEIRNPLSTLRLNLQLAAEDAARAGPGNPGNAGVRLQRMQQEVDRLQAILDDFLKYAGQHELHPTDADLRAMVEEVVDFFRPQAEVHRVVIRALLPDVPVPCRADTGLLKQALLNLLINATQAMTEGGELILRLGRQGARATIEVIDTGPGIPPEVRAKIFDAYFSTRPGGSGLGLPTTKRIVRQHEGDIAVESEPGKGTRFVVTLPLSGPEA